jgi:hypothetical protein
MLYVYLSGCSFASGGDSDSLDYIAYVAKDNAGIALTTLEHTVAGISCLVVLIQKSNMTIGTLFIY